MNMLLRRILEEPYSDAARLVYADWLEEQGEGERAEFIRVQMQIAEVRAELDEMDKQDLDQYAKRKPRKRLKELLRLEKDGFWSPQIKYLLTKALDADLTIDPNPRPSAAPFSRTGTLAKLSRGFISSISLPCAAFMQHAKAIFEAQPVTSVRLTDASAHTLMGRHRFYPVVSRELVDKLVGIRECPREPQDGFATEAEALAHLSSLCVSYGRKLANLPPLVEQKPSPCV